MGLMVQIAPDIFGENLSISDLLIKALGNQKRHRGGSNENTTITFSHDVKIGGKDIGAGTYGVFLDVEKEGAWSWIFSKNSTSWGSYFYDPKEDVLRVQTTAIDAPYTEWLTYGFEDRGPSSTTAYLQWEKKQVPLKIEVPNSTLLS